MEESCQKKESVHKCNSDPGGRSPNAERSSVVSTGSAYRRHKSSSGRTKPNGASSSGARKCVLTLDGYSYVIVASPPGGRLGATGTAAGGGVDEQVSRLHRCTSSAPSSVSTPPTVLSATPEASANDSSTSSPHQNNNSNGQLSKQGSLTIVRRSSTKKSPTSGGGRCMRRGTSLTITDDEALDEIDLTTENLPAIDTPDACDKAALRLRCLLRQLQKGEVSAELLQKNLRYASRVLEAVYIDETKRLADEDDELSEVQPDAVPPEVREWLASTFTRQLATARKRADEKPKFRSVAHAIRAGIFVERMYRKGTNAPIIQFPIEVVRVLETLDEWSFDVFDLNEATCNQPLKYLGYDLLNRYGIFHKFKVPSAVMDCFLTRVEEGYCRYKNPYHNNLHAADVAQCIHYMLYQTGLMNWLTDLEIFATLIAAIVHDYEHTGTTNNFHVMSGTDTALLYNDRAVLENHHVSATFRLMREDESNILQHLSREEYREFRTLVIDMVLATDMSFHFQQLKNMRNLLTLTEPFVDKSKALSLVLHCCDIAHPAKRWDLHRQWTSRLLEEFFLQGDKERELELPFSPLCDRNNTHVAESQIGFIDFIVEPSMAVCGDMLEVIVGSLNSPPIPKSAGAVSNISQSVDSAVLDTQSSRLKIHKPWVTYLAENKKKWKDQAAKEAEARSAAEAKNAAEATDSEKGLNSGTTENQDVSSASGATNNDGAGDK